MSITVKRLMIRLALLSVLAAVSAAAFGCDPGGEMMLPDELVGTWTTTAPAYAGHSLRLSSTTVGFGADGGDSIYPIRRVTHEQELGRLLYTVTYTDQADQAVSFYYDPADGGTITLKNQREFYWKKEG
ncbi:MAG: hypothetical protein HY208_04445 [Nitrospirae bacterium]|nr:hypothetical protein [Nitrospirota bacterium]